MGKSGPSREVILEVSGATKCFGKVWAVDRVDMDIFRGEVLCIVGSNGAGKTTLLKLITGGHPIDQGNIIFMGADISRLSLVKRARLGIVYSFQIPALFEWLSAWDSVSLALLTRQQKALIFYSRLVKFSKIREEAQHILGMFNVPKDSLAEALPHGQRKLLDVAMAFAFRPKLLLLDEPTSGVSSEEKGRVMDTIMPSILGSGITTVIVEHDMDIVARYAHRVIVMDQGRIFAQGVPDEVMADEKVQEVLLGHVSSNSNQVKLPDWHSDSRDP